MLCTDQILSEIKAACNALKASEADSIDEITFFWEGVQVTASCGNNDLHKNYIHVSMDIGKLYFTAENEYNRNESIKQIYQKNRKTDGQFTIHKRSSVHFSSFTAIQKKLSIKEFIKAVTLIMLAIGPHIRDVKTCLRPI